MNGTLLSRPTLPIALFLLLLGIGCSPVIELGPDDKIGAPLSAGDRAVAAAATASKPQPKPPARTTPKTTRPNPKANKPRTIKAPEPPPSRSATKRWYENVKLGPIELDAQDKPNWNARYDQYHDAYLKAFRLPKAKENMSVELGDGRMRNLVFESVSGDMASFSLPGKGEIGVQKENLGTITRARLFRNDAATYVTNRKIRFEKTMLDAGKVTKLPPKRAPKSSGGSRPAPTRTAGPTSPMQPYQPAGGSSGSHRAPKAGATGETPQVTRFIEDHIRDPQIMKWYPIQRDPRGEGFTQDVQIKAYGGKTLGHFQERKRIFMRDNGSVYRQMNIK